KVVYAHSLLDALPILIETKLKACEVNITGHFFLVPDPGTLAIILDALGVKGQWPNSSGSECPKEQFPGPRMCLLRSAWVPVWGFVSMIRFSNAGAWPMSCCLIVCRSSGQEQK